MRERYPGIPVVRAEILRSARLPLRMVVAVVAVGPVLLLLAQAVQVGASGKKGPQQVLLRHTAQAVGAMVFQQQA